MMIVSHSYHNSFVLILRQYVRAPVLGRVPPWYLGIGAIYFSVGFPGDPAAFHELKTRSTISSTPVPSLMLVKIVGPSPLMSFASRSMTSRDADTIGAISICQTLH